MILRCIMETNTLDIKTKYQNDLAFTALVFAMIEDDKNAERVRLKMRERYEMSKKAKEGA